MGGLLIVFAVLAIGATFSLQKTWHAVRTLRLRCATELRQLHGHLANHHLIVSHLIDSLPETFAGPFDRAQMNEVRERAEQSIDSMDANYPRAADIRNFASHQQELFELVTSLTNRISTSPSIREIQSVAGCLLGLADVNAAINDATTAYNSSVITYRAFLESPQSSLVSRIINSPAEFCIVDLGQYSSDSSSSC